MLARTVVAFLMPVAPLTAHADPLPSRTEARAIIVTGSRIDHTLAEADMPAVRLDRDVIARFGDTHIQDTLAHLPSVGHNISRTTSNLYANANAVATVNLRNLGGSRTLVLINGRRTIGIAGTTQVDLNAIPADLIDRVEVVTGGTSAVYGSDAIAGVVNILLRPSFTGIELRAQQSLSSRADAARTSVSMLGGGAFAGDRGHVVLTIAYDRDAGLPSRNRAFAAHDNPALSTYSEPGLFSAAPDGAFSPANGRTFTFDAQNRLKLYESASADGYDRSQQRLISLPVGRVLGGAILDYELAGSVRLHAEGLYAHSRSRAGLEPAAIASSGPGTVRNFDGSVYRGIPVTSAIVPAAIRAAAASAGVSTIQFRRRASDIFDRSNVNDRDIWRAVLGVSGAAEGDLRYDLSFVHPESRDHTRAGGIYMPNFGASLDARVEGGSLVCAEAGARAAGCVPIDIFGRNTVTPAGAAWLGRYSGPTQTLMLADGPAPMTSGQSVAYDYRAASSQDVLTLSVSAKPLMLAASTPVTAVVGAEYRRESSRELYDPFTRAGLSSGAQIRDTVGRYQVAEAFAEIDAPLVSDRPGMAELRLNAAVRHADYTTAGGVWSYRLGAVYAPLPDLHFRAAFARASRAPNIRELFAAQTQSFPGVTDPCDQGGGRGDAEIGRHGADPLAATCAANPAIAATKAALGEFVYSTAQRQSIDGLVGGNPDLQPEVADTLTAGVALTPRALPGFSFSADLYAIKVRDAIGIVGQQISVSQCLGSGDPVFCGNVTRDANGFITRVNALSINTASALVRGLDLAVRHGVAIERLGEGGAAGLEILWTHRFAQRQTPYPGAPVQDELRQAACFVCGRLGSAFVDRGTGALTVGNARFSVAYGFDYFGPLFDNLDGSTTPTRLRPYLYHNLRARVRGGIARTFEFYAGVSNLTDEQPPQLTDGNPAQWPGTGTVADSYDVYGRMLFLGASIRF